MNHANSGLANGTSGSSQETLENQEMSRKAKENEERIESESKEEFNSESLEVNDSKYKDFSKVINEDKQGKHIPGHKNYISGRSKILIPIQLRNLCGKIRPSTFATRVKSAGQSCQNSHSIFLLLVQPVLQRQSICE